MNIQLIVDYLSTLSMNNNREWYHHFLSQNLLSHGSPFLGITIFLIYKL